MSSKLSVSSGHSLLPRVMDARKDEGNGSKKSGRVRANEGEGVVVMGRCCGEGRVWIFLVLGLLTLVFTAVLTGIYFNVRSLTASMDKVEVMPSLVPMAAAGLAGVLMLLLFWRRYKILVYCVLVVCAVAVVLCIVAAVLTGTHVLQPLMSMSDCTYNRRERLCQCITQFRREGLVLDRVATGEKVYLTMLQVSGCSDVQHVLPGMLFTMIGIYGVAGLVCAVAGVITLLVHRTEQRRKYVEDMEDDGCSPPPSPPSSDNYGEHSTMLPTHTGSSSNGTTLINIYTNPNTSATEEDNNTNDDGNTTPSDSPSDVPMGYAEACRMRRCHSFSQPKRGTLREGSPVSSASSQTASLIGGERNGGGRLKEHRKKGRRAVTLHGLDREQLLLILSLQMRYLQESEQSAKRDAASNNFNSVDDSARDFQGDATRPPQFAQLQRRAMTPTPRQERLSSSRTTDDDLDYRPAKLVRSHTPQPYHYKNPSHYSQNVWSSSQSHPQQQQYQQQQLHHHQQQPDDDEEEEEEEEPPTVITYDLRNIAKTGPLVYENMSSATACGNLYSPQTLGTATSVIGAVSSSQPRPTPGTTQSHQSPGHVVVLGGNIQGSGCPISRQTSQASSSSQPSLESSPSDSRKLIPSREKTPEPSPAKTKGKKKFLRKDKNLKKEEVSPASNTQQNGLRRTDSNTSKSGAVADRWQTLMGDDSKQCQTLWENVQRKIVSDPQTPDSTLDMRHPPPPLNHQNNLNSFSYQHPQTKANMPDHNSYQTAHAQRFSPGIGYQTIPNGILKNSNSMSNYPLGSRTANQNMVQSLPAAVNSSQNLPYPNPYPVFTAQNSAHHHEAFIPIANSSIDNYEDVDDVFSPGHIQGSEPLSVNFGGISPPPKPPRVAGWQVAGTHLPSAEGMAPTLRPKSYMNAVGVEDNGKNEFVPRKSSLQAQGQDMMSHLLMEGSVKDNEWGHISEREGKGDGHLQAGNDYVYAQPQRRPNPGSEIIMAGGYNPSQIYQNTRQLAQESRQQPRGDGARHHQQSAFHKFGHGHELVHPFNGQLPAGHEICDTDLDDLPRSHYPGQHSGGQSPNLPAYAAPNMYPSLESARKQMSVRPDQGYSCEPYNISRSSSRRSGSSLADLQRGPQEHQGQSHVGNVSDVQSRGHQLPYISDRMFCITQQRLEKPSQRYQQEGELLYASDQGPHFSEEQSYMVMKRC